MRFVPKKLWGIEYGGIAQLGAHQTSKTPSNLFGEFAKLAIDNLQEMFYN